MNKLFTIALLLFLATTSVQSQEITFGGKIGANYAELKGYDSQNYGGVTSILAGMMAKVTFTKKIAFQPELLFTRQGFKSYEYDLVLKYISFPLMGKYYITDKFSLEAGPQLGFRSLAIAESESFGQLDVKDRIKSFDLGVNIGVAYQLENDVNFSIRYCYGLSNVNRTNINNVNNQNTAIQLSVGYYFY